MDTPTQYRGGSLAFEPLGMGGYLNQRGVQGKPPCPSRDYSGYREDTKRFIALSMPAADNLSTMSDHGYHSWGPPTDQEELKARFKFGHGDLGSRLYSDGYRGYMPQMKHLACMSRSGTYGKREKNNALF